jgi:hypothetical protein
MLSTSIITAMMDALYNPEDSHLHTRHRENLKSH